MINQILKNKYFNKALCSLSDKEYSKIFQKAINTFFDKPRILQLHINTECNFNCEYCYIQDRNAEALTLSKILDIISQSKKLGITFVDLLGGEPFMHSKLFDIIQNIHKKGMYTTIFTNGSFLNSKNINRLKPFKNRLTLVVKYDYKKSYSKQTKTKGLFNKIKKSIGTYVNEGFRVITFTVVTKRNITYIDEVIQESISLGAFPMFERYMPVKDQKVNTSLEINKKEWANVIKKIYETYRPYKEIIKSLAFLKGGVCSCYQNSICITADGYVLPCPETPFELNLGNVKERSLKKIWQESKNIRRDWNRIPPECSYCKSKNICGGGCKAYTYIKRKNFDRKDPLCNTSIPSTYTHCVYSLVRLFDKKVLK